MFQIFTSNDIERLSDGNTVLGSIPKFVNSCISFHGENNVIYFDGDVMLSDCELIFNGSNSLVYLEGSKYKHTFALTVHNNSVFFMGKDNYMNPSERANIILSEGKHCIIGSNCIFSHGIYIRNADAHLIYDINTMKRINATKSIYIGDHVWIGQNALILKGTQIDSGSIVGGNSVVAGKHIPCNTSWAGNPAKQIAKDIFWDPGCVHKWHSNETKISEDYMQYLKNAYSENISPDQWVYTFNEKESLSYDEIDNDLCSMKTAREKLDYLIELNKNKTKNRFVHKFDQDT